MTTNDTRTPQERAEEYALNALDSFGNKLNYRERNLVENAYITAAESVARDAEPTTVTAEQIRTAAEYVCGPEEPRDIDVDFAARVFRAAGFRIEGDRT